jgi:hypothetical protein
MKTCSWHLGFRDAAFHREVEDNFLGSGNRLRQGEKPRVWERGKLAEKERLTRREVLLEHTQNGFREGSCYHRLICRLRAAGCEKCREIRLCRGGGCNRSSRVWKRILKFEIEGETGGVVIRNGEDTRLLKWYTHFPRGAGGNTRQESSGGAKTARGHPEGITRQKRGKSRHIKMDSSRGS